LNFKPEIIVISIVNGVSAENNFSDIFFNKIYDPVAIMEIAGDVVQHLLYFSFN
jgi:hypothetical protein